MDTTAQINGLASMVWTWGVAFAPRLLAAAVVLVAGFFIAGWAARTIDALLGRSPVNSTVRPLIVSVLRYAIIILVLLLTLGQLGFQTSSLLAVLGAAGLAVGLALQGTLSNIAAGIMLVWLRPFQTGDYIETGAISGTIESTGLFACTLRTYDGVRLFAPNSTLWNVPVRNLSRTDNRLVVLSLKLAAADDPEAARQTIEQSLAADERIAKNPAPSTFIETFDVAGTVIGVRFWIAPHAFGAVQRDVIDTLRQKLRGADEAKDTGVQQITRLFTSANDVTRFTDF